MIQAALLLHPPLQRSMRLVLLFLPLLLFQQIGRVSSATMLGIQLQRLQLLQLALIVIGKNSTLMKIVVTNEGCVWSLRQGLVEDFFRFGGKSLFLLPLLHPLHDLVLAGGFRLDCFGCC